MRSIFLAGLLLVGMAHADDTQEQPTDSEALAPEPLVNEDESTTVRDILNFHEMTDNIAIGGQPTVSQLAQVANAGYSVVVNLAMHDSDNAIPRRGQRHRFPGHVLRSYSRSLGCAHVNARAEILQRNGRLRRRESLCALRCERTGVRLHQSIHDAQNGDIGRAGHFAVAAKMAARNGGTLDVDHEPGAGRYRSLKNRHPASGGTDG